MKPGLFLSGILISIAILGSGCNYVPTSSTTTPTTTEPVAVTVSIEDFSTEHNITKDVELTAGSTLTVTLGSNATTGFNWSEQSTIGDTAVLRQDSHEYVEPAVSGVVGAAGTEVWTFTALQAGSTMVNMEYSRPWEGGEKGEWTFQLNVTVK